MVLFVFDEFDLVFELALGYRPDFYQLLDKARDASSLCAKCTRG